jgi:hypothetical protein
MRQVRVVAAYRDRWGIGGQTVVGKEADVSTIEQLGHHKLAQLAVRKAQTISKLGGEQRQDHTNPTDPTAAVAPSGIER